jgi:hypothetical protein
MFSPQSDKTFSVNLCGYGFRFETGKFRIRNLIHGNEILRLFK